MPDEDAQIELGEKPEAMGIIRDRLYITSLSSNSTLVFETKNSTTLADIKVGQICEC